MNHSQRILFSDIGGSGIATGMMLEFLILVTKNIYVRHQEAEQGRLDSDQLKLAGTGLPSCNNSHHFGGLLISTFAKEI